MFENSIYNPDVLNCLANLSNDEVFTPPTVVNQMLDMLPQELFCSSKTKFLDPVSKSGVFLREIAKRLIVGLAEEMPDLQERVDHIFQHQLFGIAITELTSLLSRRSVYCSKSANGKYASCTCFNDTQGNIRYRSMEHSFERGKCKYCGAAEDVFGKKVRGNLESHAYEFIHELKNFKNMKFDVIIGNPPYQLNIGIEKDDYAIPLYHRFIEQAIKLSPRYLTMIIPARWYAGGRGLDGFRSDMLHDERLSVIHDFPDSSDCFNGVNIRGGVCYFLWEKEHKGDCNVTTHMHEQTYGPITRPLLEKGSGTFIRYNQAIPILRKIYTDKTASFSTLVSSQTPFGLVSSYKGEEEKKSDTDLKLYLSGHGSEFRGKNAFVPLEKLSRGQNMINWHKVYLAEASSPVGNFPHGILTVPFYGEPGTVCTQSYLVIGEFKDKRECENVISYIKTRLFRFMVLLKKNTQHNMSHVFQFVPLQDFSHPWTDEMLYEKYGLTEDEIAFIESMIRPME